MNAWQATKGGKGARVYTVDPKTRKVTGTMELDFTKKLSDEQIFKVLKSQFPHVFEEQSAAVGG